MAGPVAKTSARALRFAAAQAQKAPVKQNAEDHPVVGLQRAAGNDAVTELLKSMGAPGTRGRKGFDPRNRQAWSLLGGGNIRKNFPEEFEATLAAAPEAELAAEERVKRKGPPKEGEELESFEAELRTMIRMRALGLMAAHRATIEGRRDETLAASRGKKSGATSEAAGGGAAAPTAEETATAIRAAAAQIGKLEELKTELRGYERRIDIVRREVLVSGRSNATIEAWVEELGDATKAYRGDEITERWNNGIDALIKAGRPDAMAAPLWKLAMSLRSWRLGQIAATREAIGQFYDAFPFFAQLEPSKIAQGGYADTPKLMTGVETAFARLLDKVDDAIVEIGTGDIDPYDLPEAMAKVREELPENLLPAYDRVMRNHQTREFWTGMGLGLFQAAVIFVPVVGPLIAAGIGVAQAGSHLESMLDRVVMAEASARPEGVTLGVGAPGAFEWAMFGVEAIMAAVDLGGAIKGLRASAAEFGMKRRPPASEERPPTKRSTRDEPPEPHEPPPSARKEQAPREKAAKEDVGAARKQTPEETRLVRENQPPPTAALAKGPAKAPPPKLTGKAGRVNARLNALEWRFEPTLKLHPEGAKLQMKIETLRGYVRQGRVELAEDLMKNLEKELKFADSVVGEQAQLARGVNIKAKLQEELPPHQLGQRKLENIEGLRKVPAELNPKAPLPREQMSFATKSLPAESLAEQKTILGMRDRSKAGLAYEKLVKQHEEWVEPIVRHGRRPDIGRTEITIEGVNGPFGDHKMQQLWLDLVDTDAQGIRLIVPKLSDPALDQLRRLGAAAEEMLGPGNKVFIEVIETLP